MKAQSLKNSTIIIYRFSADTTNSMTQAILKEKSAMFSKHELLKKYFIIPRETIFKIFTH